MFPMSCLYVSDVLPIYVSDVFRSFVYLCLMYCLYVYNVLSNVSIVLSMCVGCFVYVSDVSSKVLSICLRSIVCLCDVLSKMCPMSCSYSSDVLHIMVQCLVYMFSMSCLLFVISYVCSNFCWNISNQSILGLKRINQSPPYPPPLSQQ